MMQISCADKHHNMHNICETKHSPKEKWKSNMLTRGYKIIQNWHGIIKSSTMLSNLVG
jgi:hypothetical protein